MASLDIWNWQERLIQPQQLVELKQEEKRVYTGIVDPERINEFLPLAGLKMPSATVSEEGNGRFALLWSDLPYQRESQWDISSRYDVWVMDLADNSLHEVARPLQGSPMLSPQGNYVFWWNAKGKHWFVYDNLDKSVRNLTEDIPVNFWNEKHDMPSYPGPYGIASWGENMSTS